MLWDGWENIYFTVILSGTNDDIIVKLIGSKASTDEIRIENRGNVAQTNQIDQFDIAHEGLLRVLYSHHDSWSMTSSDIW